MRTRTLLGLIGINVVWSAHPAMSKLVLEVFPPAHAALFRYGGALVAYLVLAPFLRKPFMRPQGSREWLLVALLGFATFFFAPLTQMLGLETARATDNTILVALEPLMTVLIARIVLGERLLPAHVFSFALALAGFLLLTGAQLAANLLLLLAIVGDSSYSSFGRKLMARHPPTAVFGTALVIGVVLLIIAALAMAGVPDFSRITPRVALGVLWLGPLGSALGYLFWMIALSEATVASIALMLFIQPVMGIAWGALFLDERMSPAQAAGGALILIAVISGEWAALRASRNASAPRPRE